MLFAGFVLSVSTIPVTLQFSFRIEGLLANIADISFPRILIHSGPSICDFGFYTILRCPMNEISKTGEGWLPVLPLRAGILDSTPTAEA